MASKKSAVRSQPALRAIDPHEERFAQISRRVCLIRRSQGSEATGFLVAPDLMLTTAHALRGTGGVFADPAEVTILFDQFIWDQRTGMRAFGASCGLRHIPFTRQPDVVASSIKIDATSQRQTKDNGLDYVLVRLDRAIGLDFLPFSNRIRGWNNCNAGAPLEGHVVVIQHPLGGIQDVADGKIAKNHKSREFAPFFKYKTETLVGSSGSPVYNAANEVIAIHVGETVRSQLGVSFKAVFDDFRKKVNLPPFPPPKEVVDSIFGMSETEKARDPQGTDWRGDRLFDTNYVPASTR